MGAMRWIIFLPFFLSFFFEMKNLKKAKEKVAFNVGSMYHRKHVHSYIHDTDIFQMTIILSIFSSTFSFFSQLIHTMEHRR